MPHTYCVSLYDRCLRNEFVFGFQFCKELEQRSAVELPFKWARLSIAQFFVQPQSLLDFLQAGEIVRGQHLPLDDRKINFHLIEPTGMDRRMYQDCLAVSLSQSPDRCLTAVGRAIVNDPENTAGRSVWLTPHHLIDQSAERVDSGLILASTQDSTAANVPDSQVLQGSAPSILMLHSHGASRTRRQSRVTSDSGLDARLLVRADDIIPTTQRFAVPGASIQIQHSPSFFGELRVAGKDPVLISPGFDRVSVEDSPDGTGTDRSAQGHRSSVGQVRIRQPTQWQLGQADSLTGDRLDDRPVARGKKRACVYGPLYQPRRSCRMPNGDASVGRNGHAVPREHRPRRSISPVIRGAREPTKPVGAGRAGPFACGQASGIHQGTGQGTWVDQEVRAQAWCDSIRKRRSAFRPNVLRIGHTTRPRNLTINCEMDHLAVLIVHTFCAPWVAWASCSHRPGAPTSPITSLYWFDELIGMGTSSDFGGSPPRSSER